MLRCSLLLLCHKVDARGRRKSLRNEVYSFWRRIIEQITLLLLHSNTDLVSVRENLSPRSTTRSDSFWFWGCLMLRDSLHWRPTLGGFTLRRLSTWATSSSNRGRYSSMVLNPDCGLLKSQSNRFHMHSALLTPKVSHQQDSISSPFIHNHSHLAPK